MVQKHFENSKVHFFLDHPTVQLYTCTIVHVHTTHIRYCILCILTLINLVDFNGGIVRRMGVANKA